MRGKILMITALITVTATLLVCLGFLVHRAHRDAKLRELERVRLETYTRDYPVVADFKYAGANWAKLGCGGGFYDVKLHSNGHNVLKLASVDPEQEAAREIEANSFRLATWPDGLFLDQGQFRLLGAICDRRIPFRTDFLAEYDNTKRKLDCFDCSAISYESVQCSSVHKELKDCITAIYNKAILAAPGYPFKDACKPAGEMMPESCSNFRSVRFMAPRCFKWVT